MSAPDFRSLDQRTLQWSQPDYMIPSPMKRLGEIAQILKYWVDRDALDERWVEPS